LDGLLIYQNEMMKRVVCSDEAAELIHELRSKFGELMFHQSGGCCDGSAPMCFQKDEFRIGESDVLLGFVADCPFYMSADQFEYWKHTQLTLTVVPGRGSSFSLEIPTGKRFIIQSRLFSNEELNELFTNPTQ
jgi:uncharacterized protein (DUF779 family)